MVDAFRQLTLDLLVGAIRHPNATIRRQLAEAFWDLQYLYKFGIPKLPPPEGIGPYPPRPQPDPSPLDRIRVHEELLLGLVDVFDGDPNPEPNLQGILRDKGIRLAAAKALSQRLTGALQGLNKEIARLERLP
jgi:hypothetical protein